MTRYVFAFADPDATDGTRELEIDADDLKVTRFDGTTFAKDSNGKVRASAPASDFIELRKRSDDAPDDFVDVRHHHS